MRTLGRIKKGYNLPRRTPPVGVMEAYPVCIWSAALLRVEVKEVTDLLDQFLQTTDTTVLTVFCIY